MVVLNLLLKELLKVSTVWCGGSLPHLHLVYIKAMKTEKPWRHGVLSHQTANLSGPGFWLKGRNVELESK